VGNGTGTDAGSKGSDGGGTGDSATGTGDTGTVDSAPVDAAPVCSNTDLTLLPIDATGWVARACNDYQMQGAWYCYADGIGTSDCVTGVTPYVASSKAMCLSGTTSAASTAYGAAIGLELNASGGAASVKGAYDATTNNVIGFQITITGSSGGVALRLSLTGGATTTDTQPFVELPGAGTYQVLLADAVVPASFTGASAGSRANPAAIYDVQLAIPASAAVTYDYCITELKPILAGAVTAPTACATPVAYGNPVCGPQDLLGEVGAYAVQNNVNGTGTAQCVQALAGGTCGGFAVTFPDGSFGSGGNSPSSYPSIVYGWQAGSFYGGYRTAKQLSAINSIPTMWQFTTPAGGKWDAAYDIWFSPQAAPVTANGGLELMVWPNYGGGAQPSGSMTSTVTIGSTGSWEVWKSSITVGSATWQYIAYRKQPGSSASLSFDVKSFANDAVTENVGLSNSSYLLGVQAGFEIWSASQGATIGTTSFSASVQ
jgi:cellulose 1,4-beta-cellobiosidase